jgi:hypothetical protein
LLQYWPVATVTGTPPVEVTIPGALLAVGVPVKSAVPEVQTTQVLAPVTLRG